MRKIKLLHIINGLQIGGAEKLAGELCRRVHRDKIQASLCGLSPSSRNLVPFLETYGVDYCTLDKKDGKDYRLPWRLKRLLRDKEIDIVHTHNEGALLYTYAAMKLMRHRPYLVHTEHIDLHREVKNYRKAFLLNSLLYRSLDGFVSIAHQLKPIFERDFKPLKNKVHTIANGINLNNYSTQKTDYLRDELNLNSNISIIGNVSVLRPQKDHESLIRAFALTVQARPNTRLVIVGDGEEIAMQLRELISKLNLEDSVYLLGSRTDVPRILSSLNLFVLPSLYEGLSLCLLEASAAGLPIVTTDVPGNSELVQHRENGLLVPPQDSEKLAEAMLMMLSEPSLANSLGKKAREKVEQEHDIVEMADRYVEYYQSFFGRRNGCELNAIRD